MILTLEICVAILCVCAGVLIAIQAMDPVGHKMALLRRRSRKTPTFEEAVELAVKDQIAHERHLASRGIHYWSQQRERAVLQRIEKLMGKVASPTMASFVRTRLLQVEVVNLSPHKPKR